MVSKYVTRIAEWMEQCTERNLTTNYILVVLAVIVRTPKLERNMCRQGYC
jgi:hypothetical protein